MQVAGESKQLGVEDRPEAEHRLNDVRLMVVAKGGGDLLIKVLRPTVKLKEARG